MDNELDSQKSARPMTEVEAKTGLGLGIKVFLGVVILGAVAAGIAVALVLAQ